MGLLDKERYSCLLVLDSNILIKDLWWEGKELAYLRNRGFFSHRIFLSEVVLKEVKQHIREKAENILSDWSTDKNKDRVFERYKKLFRDENIDYASIDNLLLDYENFILRIIELTNGYFFKTPQTNIEEILNRSIDRIKPFNKGDKGFRDTLIWLGIVELTNDYNMISFVSQNKNDFSDDGNNLHPDLQKEISTDIKFKFFSSIKKFIIEFNSPPDYLGVRSYFLESLQMGRVEKFDLDMWIDENLLEVIRSCEDAFDGVDWVGLPYFLEAPILDEIEDIVAVEIRNIDVIDEDKLDIAFTVSLIGFFDCETLVSDLKNIIHPRQLFYSTENSNGIWERASIRLAANFLILLRYSIESGEVIKSTAFSVAHDAKEALDFAKGYFDNEV